MFNYDDIIKRVIKFFPKWTDIRKRYEKSTGGKFLSSIVEESLDIEQALKEYTESYFLDTYYESHEDVVAFIFSASIGIVENLEELTITYKEQELIIAKDINDFFNNMNSNYTFYEEGKLYIAISHVTDDSKLNVDFNGYNSDYDLTKTHLWNIFDEFACFIGIERQHMESNGDLINRILYKTKNLPNSSKEGLKDAIISELLTLYPNIDKDEIEITALTPETLHKPYKSFESLLDMLNEMNRDVLRHKRWDLDQWQYNFKSIEYIDNKWNEAIASFQNGVGNEDSLKVIIADASETTDATVTLFDKSEERLLAYVHNKQIEKNIKLRIKRYNNIINSINVKYRINASKAIDITNEEIELSIYEDTNRTEKRYVQDLYKFGKGIVKLDNSKLTDNNRYRLEFVASENDVNMEISKINIQYKNRHTNAVTQTTNLLKQAPGFILNAEGSLVNTSIKKSVRNVNHFNSYTGLQSTTEGITLGPNADYGQGILSVSGLGLNFITMNVDYKTSILPKDIIRINNYAFWSGDTLTFRYDIPQQRRFDIDVTANVLSFDILDDCHLDLFVDDGITSGWSKFVGPGTFKSNVTDKARNIKITMIGSDDNLVRFNNFEYANYEVNLKLQNGNILETGNGQIMLPNFTSNSLIVEMRAKSGSSPVLKGLYIGGDLSKAIYRTDIIQHITDCDRLFDIKTNCQINLLKVDAYGNILQRVDNFEPVSSYKAIEDGAWIRLNTNEYSYIKSVTANAGAVMITNESGIDYYDIKLSNGEIASNITISGTRSAPARVVSLYDIIRLYEPKFDRTTDKIYCSKAADGVIIDFNQNPNPYRAVIKIKSSVFAGINASKYEFTKMPKTLGTIFGSNIGHVQSSEYTGAFDYISIYPGDAQMHTAVNEYNMFANEMRNIKTVNNFAPALNLNDMLFYSVTSMESDTNIKVKFASTHEAATPFEALNNWTIGNKDIAIKTPIDLANSDNYDISVFEVEEDTLLSKYIPLKNSYTMSNNYVISLDKCVIEPPEGVTVEYKTYNGADETSTLIKQEEIIVESDGFNKLSYSNIQNIVYIGTEPYSGNNNIPSVYDHTLLNDEGIIVWNNDQLISSATKLYIRYITKLPIALVFDNDALYKEIGYNVDAYKEMYRFVLQDMHDGEKYDLLNIERFNDVDLVYVQCKDPSFDAILNDSIVSFKKVAYKESLMVKTGYYYINGREYYLYSNDGDLSIDKPNFIDTRNVEVSGGELTLVKATNNYVRNSEMLFKGINELYDFDCTKPLTYGISKLNSLTACDTFNGWKSFNSHIRLETGLNDVAITFEPIDDTGFSYLDITEYFNNGDYLSFWASQDLQVYIGKEKLYMDMKFSRALNIELISEVKYSEDLLRLHQLSKDNTSRYYIVTKGNGKIDDIIINDKEVNDYMLHTKNIDKLGLDIEEQMSQGDVFRMEVKDNKHSIAHGADLSSDGTISMVSNIDWGLTIFKYYDSRDDFMKTHNEHVSIENDYCKAVDVPGTIETEALFINNPLTVKRLFFKINSIDFGHFKGFKSSIMTSNTKDGIFVPVASFTANQGFVYGDYLGKYIKLRIEMPKGKVLDNFGLFIEYRSDEDNYPIAITPNTGEMISKVFDLHSNVNCGTRAIKIESISNINDVEISIRASRYEYSSDVWMPWKTVELTPDLRIKNPVKIDNARFLQYRVKLKTKNAYIKVKYIDVEVI